MPTARVVLRRHQCMFHWYRPVLSYTCVSYACPSDASFAHPSTDACPSHSCPHSVAPDSSSSYPRTNTGTVLRGQLDVWRLQRKNRVQSLEQRRFLVQENQAMLQRYQRLRRTMPRRFHMRQPQDEYGQVSCARSRSKGTDNDGTENDGTNKGIGRN